MPRLVMPVVALLALATGCAGGADPVPTSHGAPVRTAAVSAPAYAALGDGFSPRGGDRIVTGDHTTPIPAQVSAATWLSNGHVLLVDGQHAWVVDPATGKQVGARVGYGAGPRVSPGRIAIIGYNSLTLRLYDNDLRLLRAIRVPRSAMKTDQLDKDPDASLSIFDPVVAGGAVWVQWAVNSENDALTDHGVLRIPESSGPITAIARNRPVVRLYAASDGRSVLALVRDHGHDVSCAGCARDDHIEEWDTRVGKVSDLGKPDGFDDWSVLALDKIGDRVAVRYRVPGGGEGGGSTQTWVRDDAGWTEQRDLRDLVVWWQQGKQLVQRLDVAKDQGDGAPFSLAYGGDTLLPVASACAPKRPVCLVITAPGPMLRPTS